jgi:hypothetical protein
MKNTKKNRKNNLRRKQIKSNKKGGLFFGSSKKTGETPPPYPPSPGPVSATSVGEGQVCQAEIQNKKINFIKGDENSTTRQQIICNSDELKCLDDNYKLVDTGKKHRPTPGIGSDWLSDTTDFQGTCKKPTICQAELLNKKGDRDRDQKLCGVNEFCATSLTDNAQIDIKTPKKAKVFNWSEKEKDSKYKGYCKPLKTLKKSLMSRAGNQIWSAGRVASRSKDLGYLCAAIPRGKEEQQYPFSKNLWRNLKRNMLILASTNSLMLEEALITKAANAEKAGKLSGNRGTKSQEDFNNLIEIASKSVELDSKVFDQDNGQGESVTGETAQGGKSIKVGKRGKRKNTLHKKKYIKKTMKKI